MLIPRRVRPVALQLLLVIASLLVLLSSPVRANSSDRLTPKEFHISNVHVGFDGYFKVGRWTEIRFDFDSMLGNVRKTFQHREEETLSIGVMDPSGSYFFTTVQLEQLNFEERAFYRNYYDVRVPVKFGRPDSNIIVRWNYADFPTQTFIIHPEDPNVETDMQSIRFHKGLKNSTRLWGVLGNPKEFTLLEEDEKFHVVYFEKPTDLPRDSLGYDSLDALLVVGDYQIPEETNTPLEEWVRMGGNLFVSVGREVPAYQKSLLAKWNPIPVTGERIFRSMNKIESFSDKKLRIRFNGRVQGAQLGEAEGDVLIEDLNIPMLQRAPYGFGVVTLFAIDVAKPPLSKWKMLPPLLHKMVEGKRILKTKTGKKSKALSQSGVTDLKTQLTASVENYPEVKRVSSWYVMGAMMIFLLLIGPIDYFIVCHLLKKPQLTWITLPLIVFLAVGWGLMMARKTNGDKLRLNQLEFIDIDSSTHSVRMQNWYAVYSPHNQRYKVESVSNKTSWDSSLPSGQTHLIWSGNPEDSYTGMYRTGGAEFDRPEYRLMDDGQGVENLPVPIWSAQVLNTTQHIRLSHSSQKQSSEASLFESRLSSTASGQLNGDIVSHLPVPVDEWMMVYRGRVYRSKPGKGIESIQPDVPIRFSRGNPLMQQRELKSFLTGTTSRSIKREGETDSRVLSEKSVYDPLNRNIEDIARMVSFHEAAGGTSYTQLQNHLLKNIDLTAQLRLGRAVLYGRLKQPVNQLQIQSARQTEDPLLQSDTFVRIVLPVKRDINTDVPLPKLNKN